MTQALVVQNIEDVQYRDYTAGQVVDFPGDILAWLKSRKLVDDTAARVASAIAGGAQVLTHTAAAAPWSGNLVIGADGTITDPSGVAAVRKAAGVGVSEVWKTAWDVSAQKDLGTYVVTGPLALTSDETNPAVGGYTQACIIANGTNVPTFDGATLPDWTNTAGARNFVTLFRAGNYKFWAIGSNLGVAIGTKPVKLTVTGCTEIGSTGPGWSYVTTVNDIGYNGSHSGVSTLKIPANNDGYFEYTVGGATSNLQPHIAMKTSSTLGSYALTEFGVYGNTGAYRVTRGGVDGNPTTSRSVALGDVVRVERAGTTGIIKINDVTIHTFSGISAGDMYLHLVCADTTAPANYLTGKGVE